LNPVFISHYSVISPCHRDNVLVPLAPATDADKWFVAQEPDYTRIIPPMQLRRMGRILKMGVYAGMDCIMRAGLERPDGIITGTGKGSMLDTEKFVRELETYQETALNPTPFILSTYNAVNGAIALQTQATGYNQTYVHRGSSFETSFYDACLGLYECSEPTSYLVGCFDEITPEYHFVKGKVGYWKPDGNHGRDLLQQCHTPGTIAGEGAAFFMLNNESRDAMAAVLGVHSFYQPEADELADILLQQLSIWNATPAEISMLVLGNSGDARDEEYYQRVRELFPGLPVLCFKHLCGEYETAGGFATTLICDLLSGKKVPEQAWLHPPASGYRPGKILYYNHYRTLNHNLLLFAPAEA
jgi:hypothetical protein